MRAELKPVGPAALFAAKIVAVLASGTWLTTAAEDEEPAALVTKVVLELLVMPTKLAEESATPEPVLLELFLENIALAFHPK